MKFSNDRQRRAVFANLFSKGSNKFAVSPEMVEGYTGSRIYADPYGDKSAFVTLEGVPVDIDETAILAGERYKSAPSREDVIRLRDEEYLAGMPVYSSIPSLSDVEFRKLQERCALMDAEKNLAKIEQAQDIERGIISPSPVVATGDNFVMYSELPQKEYISGGYAEGKRDDEFDPVQLEKGIQVEMEHVVKFTDKGNVRKPKDTDLAKAKEISKDHLSEIPDYYDRLEKLEEGAKEEGVFVDVGAAKKAGEFARDPRVIRSSDVTGFVKPEFDEAMMKPVTIVPKSDISARILAAKTRSGIEQMEDR